MAKRKRKVDSWQLALNAATPSNYIPVDNLVSDDNLISDDNPERSVIRKDLFLNLSSEAKYIIHLVLESPLEILEMVGLPEAAHKYKHRYKRKLSIFLGKERGNQKIKTEKALREIAEFLEEV